MQDKELYQHILGLPSSWSVSEVKLQHGIAKDTGPGGTSSWKKVWFHGLPAATFLLRPWRRAVVQAFGYHEFNTIQAISRHSRRCSFLLRWLGSFLSVVHHGIEFPPMQLHATIAGSWIDQRNRCVFEPFRRGSQF